MPELPFAVTAKDVGSLIDQVQLLFNDLYEERIGGANVGDVFQIGSDDVLQLRLADSGGIEKSSNTLKVKPDTTKGIELSSNGIKTKIKSDKGIAVDDDGLYVLLKPNNGLDVDSLGVYVKLKSGYGIDVDADGLKLKQQSGLSDASAVSSFSGITGTDSIDLADLNAKFATLVTEINAIKDKVNSIITQLELAEILVTV